MHGGLAVAIAHIETKESRAATAIEIAETKKREPEKKPPAEVKPDLPPESKKLARRSVAAAAPKPAEAPPPVAAQPTLDSVPDFGLELSGGVGGGGLAIAAGSPHGAAPAVARALGPAVKKPLPKSAAVDECDEPAKKPRPLNVPQPAYSDRARTAGIEGKVRVELTVDETGRVVSVRVLSGLGYGLDEAAVAAAERATFEPALRCGKATRATFTISMRFSSS